MIQRDRTYFVIFCIVFWVEITLGFITEEIVPPLQILPRMSVLAGDFILFVMGLMLTRTIGEKLLIISLYILGFISTIYINGESFLNLFNGSRDFFGILFVPIIIRYFYNCKEKDWIRESFIKQLKIFLYIQAFCITEQFIRYGANDHGGGSMGNGASGMVSILIISTSFYLVTLNWNPNEYLKSLWKNRLWIFLMYPVLLNETKASFVLITLYFILLLPGEFKSILKVLAALPFAVVLGLGLIHIYQVATHQTDEDVASIEYISKYLEGDDEIDQVEWSEKVVLEGLAEEDFGDGDLPRFLKHTEIQEPVASSPGHELWGAGLGQFKGGTFLDPPNFYRKYEWLLHGTVTTYMFLYVQLGIMGIIWYVICMTYWLAFNITKRGGRNLSIKFMLLGIVVLTFMYNDFFRYTYATTIFFFILMSANRYKDDDQEIAMPQKRLEIS